MKFRYVSLFAGIGGFDLGFDRSGMRCALQCEIDRSPQSILRRHWPDVPKVFNVKHIEAILEIVPPGTADVVCGGFPCQDYSLAGERAGLAGNRGALWWPLLRVVEALKPRVFVGENVCGILSSNGGRDFHTIIQGLVNCGYGVCWRVFDSKYAGVAQQRRRVFIVGCLGNGRAAEILFEPESLRWDSAPRRGEGQAVEAGVGGSIARCLNAGRDGYNDGSDQTYIVASAERSNALKCGQTRLDDHETLIPVAYRTSGNCGVMEQGDKTGALNCMTDPCQTIIAFCGADGSSAGATALAFTERSRPGGRTIETSEIAYALTNPGSGGRTHSRQVCHQMRVRRLTPRECERLQGFPDDWTRWDDKGRKLKDSPRYRMLGNAVTVTVSEWIGRQVVRFS